MKKSALLLICLLQSVFSTAQPVEWGNPTVYDFDPSDIDDHDNVWNNGWMWDDPYWAYDTTWWCNNTLYTGCDLLPKPVKLFPGLVHAYYNTTAVGTGSVSANSNIQYMEEGDTTFVRLKTIYEPGATPYPGPNELPDVHRDYSTAVLWHKSMSTFGYGKYEIRCRFPSNVAVGNCGLWTYFGDGEIDIAEIVNNGTYPLTSGDIPTPSFSLHGWTTADSFDPHFNIREFPNYVSPKPNATTRFHIYTFEWTPDFMRLFFDNKQMFIIERSQVNYFPSSTMSLIVSNGLNPWGPGGLAAMATNQNMDFDVDYIKIYPMSCSSEVLCDNDTRQNISAYNIDLAVPDVDIALGPVYELNNQVYNCYNTAENNMSQEVTPTGFDEAACENISCLKTVNNTQKLFAKAVNHVVMWPGFSANASANTSSGSASIVYKAWIDEYACNSGGARLINPAPGTLIPGNMEALKAEIYPNPSNGVFTVQAEQGSYEVSVYDIVGRKQKNFKLYGSSCELNIGELENGLYMVQIVDLQTEKKAVIRIVKEK